MSSCTNNSNTHTDQNKHNQQLKEVVQADSNDSQSIEKEVGWGAAFQSYMEEKELLKAKDDKLELHLAFDKHGADCLALDSYSTLVKFELLENRLKVDSLILSSKEVGTGKAEPVYRDVLYLKQEKEKYIVYLAEQRALILFKEPTTTGAYFYYFDALDDMEPLLNNDLSTMEFGVETEEEWGGFPLGISKLETL